MRNCILILSLIALSALALSPAAAQHSRTAKSKKTASKAPVTAPITVTVRAISEVPGSVFTLGEIAQISGKDKALMKQLSAVEVGTSPLPGLSRDLTPGDITVKLRANRLESRRVTVSAPPLMRISRAHSSLAGSALVKAALDVAKEAIGDLPNTTLEAEAPPENINLPTGKMELRTGANKGGAETGLIRVPIDVLVDGKIAQSVTIAVRVRRTMRVLIANRQLEPNDILTADDVSLAKMDLTPGFARPMTSAKLAFGKRVKRRILTDGPISANDLETPPAISINADITIEYISGPVQITARARALQSGAVGDTIRVFAADTHKELEAVILNRHTVRMIEADSADASETPDPAADAPDPAPEPEHK